MLARCLGQVQGGMLGLHGVVLAGFACLASRKAGVVDGRGRGLSPPPPKKKAASGEGLLDLLRTAPFCEKILQTSHSEGQVSQVSPSKHSSLSLGGREAPPRG